MSIKTDMNSYFILILSLFGIAILVGLTFVGLGYFEGTLCTQADADWTYQNGECLNESGSAQTVQSITYTGYVTAVIVTALGLLGLVVIIQLFSLILTSVRGIGGMGKD